MSFIWLTDIMGNPLYVRKDTITMIGTTPDGKTFFCQNGEMTGPQVKETADKVRTELEKE